MRIPDAIVILVLAGVFACTAPDDVQPHLAINVDRVLNDLRTLSHDSLAGRGVGTAGNRMARAYVERAFSEAGLQAFDSSFAREFRMGGVTGDSIVAANVMGFVKGRLDSALVIVVSAHYDHLGIRDSSVFNGADDNASGTAALLELARVVSKHPLEHDVIFLATDAEEEGLRGAREFVTHPPVNLRRIALNVNLDMISHSDSVLYVAGTYHSPFLRPILRAVAAEADIVLRLGHDDPALGPNDDWTHSSDHSPFHRRGIPFVYFGVEDHDDYHSPTDDYETINPVFYGRAVETILVALRELDHNLMTFERP